MLCSRAAEAGPVPAGPVGALFAAVGDWQTPTDIFSTHFDSYHSRKGLRISLFPHALNRPALTFTTIQENPRQPTQRLFLRPMANGRKQRAIKP